MTIFLLEACVRVGLLVFVSSQLADPSPAKPRSCAFRVNSHPPSPTRPAPPIRTRETNESWGPCHVPCLSLRREHGWIRSIGMALSSFGYDSFGGAAARMGCWTFLSPPKSHPWFSQCKVPRWPDYTLFPERRGESCGSRVSPSLRTGQLLQDSFPPHFWAKGVAASSLLGFIPLIFPDPAQGALWFCFHRHGAV